MPVFDLIAGETLAVAVAYEQRERWDTLVSIDDRTLAISLGTRRVAGCFSAAPIALLTDRASRRPAPSSGVRSLSRG